MALTTDKDKSVNETAASQAKVETTEKPQSQTTNAYVGTNPLGAMLNATVTLSSQGNPEDLSKAIEYMTAAAAESATKPKIVMVRQEASLHAPVMIIANTAKSPALYYTVIFAGHMAAPLEDKVIRNNQTGQQSVKRSAAHELNDDVLRQAVEQTLRMAGLETSAKYNVGSQVVYEDTDITDTAVLTNILNTALMAFDTILNSGNAPTASIMASKDLAITATYNIAPGTTDTNAMGQPIATDFTVTTTVAPAQRRTDTVHGGQLPVLLSKVNAITDLIYKPTMPDPFNQNPQAFYPGYSHHIIATNIEAIVGGSPQYRTESLMTFFYGMASLAGITGSMQSIYDPRYAKKPGQAFGKTPFGVVGYEHCPFPAQEGVKPEEVAIVHGQVPGPNGEMSISEALHVYCHPGAEFSADLEICGRFSWVNSVIINAAQGSEKANGFIRSTLDTFFGGRFSAAYNGNVFKANPVLIELGTKENEDGTLGDVRAVDNLTVLQHSGSTDDAVVQTYSDRHLPCGDTLEGIDECRKIVSQLENNVKFTGQAYRVTLQDGFLATIMQLFADAGLSITPVGLVRDQTNIQRSANFQVGGNANVNVGAVFHDNQNINTSSPYAAQHQNSFYGH